MNNVSHPYGMTPTHAASVLRAYVATAVLDRNGRPLADRSRLLALDALEALTSRVAA